MTQLETRQQDFKNTVEYQPPCEDPDVTVHSLGGPEYYSNALKGKKLSKLNQKNTWKSQVKNEKDMQTEEILLKGQIKLSEEEVIAAEVQTDRKILVDQSILCNVVTITEDYSESTGETYSAPKEILSKKKDVNESRSFLYKMFWCCSNCYKNTDEEIAVPIAVKTVEE
ncbi:Hypothetical predicted protein [Pelobates cultripes]|uniref:Uncharacterized protein n=1 Tax=Pelobates cultripes TaxID=61616 RepID=A0AAD1VMZ3_PELCU|nr:Hypothetical predicted protein [Pelobates cultripes]